MNSDEHTPDFDDLLAAYDIADPSAETSDNSKNNCTEGSSSSSVNSIVKDEVFADLRNEARRLNSRFTSVLDFSVNGSAGGKRQLIGSVISGKKKLCNSLIVGHGQSSSSTKIQRARRIISASFNRPPTIIDSAQAFGKTILKKSGNRPVSRLSKLPNDPDFIVNSRMSQPDHMMTAKMPTSLSKTLVKSPTKDLTAQNQHDVPDSEVVDVNSQVSTSVLPPYIPNFPNPDDDYIWAIIPSKDGFACLDCGDTFLLQKSLKQHLERRSIYIELMCTSCDKKLVFYNRCALFNHVRAHHENSELCDMSQMIIKPLSFDFLLSIEETNTDSNIPTDCNSQTLTTSIQEGGKSLINYQCPECKSHCGSQLSLKEHFGCSRNLLSEAIQCERCNMVCPSACSLNCHKRIHKRERPFICPECGMEFVEDWNVFQRHMSTVCFHLSRTTGYKCTSCSYLSTTASELQDHIVNFHIESYFKCQGCPMAFKTEANFDAHKVSTHQNEGVKCLAIYKCPHCDIVFQNETGFRAHFDTHSADLDSEKRFLYRCTICKTVFDNKTSLHGHMKDVHPSIFKLRCSVCRAAFRDHTLLRDHELRKHPKLNKDQTSSAATSELAARIVVNQEPIKTTVKLEKLPEAQNGSKESCPSTSLNNRNTCEHCNRKFHSPHGLKIHKFRSHNDDSDRLVCAVCQEPQANAQSMAKHGHAHLNAGLLVCTLCNNISFSTKFGLSRHIDNHISSFNYPMDCFYCGKKLNDASIASPHWKGEHRLFDFRCDQCDAQYLYKKSLNRHKRAVHENNESSKFHCSLCEGMEFSKHSLLLQHLELKHGTSTSGQTKTPETTVKSGSSKASAQKKVVKYGSASTTKSGKSTSKTEITDNSSADIIRQAKKAKLEILAEEGRVCVKCNYKSKNRSEFVLHVKAHNNDASMFQCLECGICFVVEPSLKKHLSFVHRVKDVDSFMEQNGYTSTHQNDHDTFKHNGNFAGKIDGLPSSSKNPGERPFECDVCRNSFDTDLSLKTHMRTHGMAFIKRICGTPSKETNKTND